MSDEDEDAWDRVLFHLENQTGFWLGLVAGDDARPRAALREKARAFWEGEGRTFVLHEPAPGKARALAVELTRQDEPALHWIRVDGEAGDEGAAELVLAMNERREAYRSRLDGGVVIEGRASVKRMVRELAPDLFSIRAFVVEPEAVAAMEVADRPEWGLQLRVAADGTTLSDPDRELDRASRLAGIEGDGAMKARFEALTRAVEALIYADRLAEAQRWANELMLLTQQWKPEDSPQETRRRGFSMGRALLAQGDLRLRRDDLKGAGQDYDAALSLFKVVEDGVGQANVLRARGALRQYCADLAGAGQDYDAALLLYEMDENRSGQAGVVLARGELRRRRDDLVGAGHDYDAALSLYETVEDRLGQASVLLARGDLRRDRRDFVGAGQDYDAALSLYEVLEIRLGQANVLLARGDLQRRRADLVGARQDCDAALSLYEAVEDRLGQANVLQARGHLERGGDDLTLARGWYEKAALKYRAIGEAVGLSNVLAELARVHARQGDKMAAEQAATEALRFASQSENRYAMRVATDVLAKIRPPV